MVYEYHQAKASESASDLVPSEDGSSGYSKKPSSRLSLYLSRSLFWTSRILLAAWLIVTFSAACLILWPKRDQGLLLALAEDPSLNVPSFDLEIQEFHLSREYTPESENVTKAEMEMVQAAWDALIPSGVGVLHVSKNLDQLPPGQPNQDGVQNEHSVAVYHELHCLFRIMKDYYEVLMGQEARVSHVRHCFEYLRLALMCHADTTLESIDDMTLIEDEEEVDGSKKPGSRHVCKRYDRIFDWMEENAVSPLNGIIPVVGSDHEKPMESRGSGADPHVL